jgi:hypothetical protein
MRYRLPALISLFAVLCVSAVAQQIRGDYIESRNADVYTGQCFANGEVNLVGDNAIVAWHVRDGSWNGVALDGLSVAAAIKAKGTLGDPYENPYPAEAVVIVDDQATPQQRAALQSFAHHMAGPLLDHVERVIVAPVAFETNPQQHGAALLRAGSFATVQTRSLGEHDHVCGNEETYYPPLTKTTHAMPAVAVTDAYNGPGLDTSWDLHGKRSAFLGTFGE